jgi:membrane-bound lytic murein transglycosylase D
MYNRPIIYLTRWATVGTVVTILLNGCASTPPTPIPIPLPGDTPQVGTGTSSNPDVGSITTGGTITLPSIPVPSSGTIPPPDDDASYHTVSPKETLYSIAKQYGHTTADIKAWNSLTSDNLPVGKRLRIAPPAGGTASTTSTSKASSCHKIVHGDTLFSIAKHYGHKVAEVAQWNGIKNLKTYRLKVGQMLQVSPDGSCQ